MKHSRSFRFFIHWRWLAVALGFAIGSLGEVRANDISGAYENLGSKITSENEASSGTISLRGLFALEFDYALARVQYSQTDRVTIRQSDTRLTIRCLDSEGEETWAGQWNRNEGYTVENGQVHLMFRSKHHESAGFLFSLSTISEQKLLLVEVRKINTTLLGPSTKLVGTFLFAPLLGGQSSSTE